MIYYTRKSSKSSNCIDCHILFDTFHCWRPYSFRFYISQPIINDILNCKLCVYLISHNCFSAKQSLEARKMRPNVKHNENVGNQTKQINIYGRLCEQTTKTVHEFFCHEFVHQQITPKHLNKRKYPILFQLNNLHKTRYTNKNSHKLFTSLIDR